MPNAGYRLVNDGGQIKAIRDDSKVPEKDGVQENAGGMGAFDKKASAGISVEKKGEKSGALLSGGFGTQGDGTEEGDKKAEEKYASEGGLRGKGQVLGGKIEGSVGASAGTDGIAVEAAAGASITLVGGELEYRTAPKTFSIGGQSFRASLGAKLSAEVIAEAKGKIGLEAKAEDGKGMTVAASAGGEAFAGARAGFELMGKLEWNDTAGGGWTDLIVGTIGLNGFAGAAAVAKVTASLVPCIEFSANIGVAVGVGGSLSLGVKMNPIAAAKVGFALAAAGVKVAWEGIKTYASDISGWLEKKGKSFRTAATNVLDSVIGGISGYFSSLWSWFW
jgi:hypothetical protein